MHIITNDTEQAVEVVDPEDGTRRIVEPDGSAEIPDALFERLRGAPSFLETRDLELAPVAEPEPTSGEPALASDAPDPTGTSSAPAEPWPTPTA